MLDLAMWRDIMLEFNHAHNEVKIVTPKRALELQYSSVVYLATTNKIDLFISSVNMWDRRWREDLDRSKVLMLKYLQFPCQFQKRWQHQSWRNLSNWYSHVSEDPWKKIVHRHDTCSRDPKSFNARAWTHK